MGAAFGRGRAAAEVEGRQTVAAYRRLGFQRGCKDVNRAKCVQDVGKFQGLYSQEAEEIMSSRSRDLSNLSNRERPEKP